MKTRHFLRMIGGIAAAAAVVAVAPAPARAQARGQRPPPLLMTTTAFPDGGKIPDKYTQASSNPVSPALSWSQVPPGTQSFVLLLHDPEPVMNHSSKMDVTHWLVWNIPASSRGLPEGWGDSEHDDGSRQVSLRSNGYMGPGAPPGPDHHYTFELYALDTTLDVPQGTPRQAAQTRNAVFDAMDGHVLGKAVLVGRFHR